jgi:thiol:disulfide interchange protein
MAQVNVADRSAISTPKVLIVVTVLLLTARIAAFIFEYLSPPPRPQGIQWIDLQEFQQNPSTNGKLILYEFYADWCDPAKRMEQTTLCNNDLRQIIEEKFVPVRITDVAREKGRNPQTITDLQKRYRVFAFPTLVIAHPNGDAASTLVGSCGSLTTYRFLSRTLSLQPRFKKASTIKQESKANTNL